MSLTKRYRQTDYGDLYTFTFEQQSNGTYAVHCSEHPRNPHSANVTDCHLYSSGQVCIRGGHEPRTLDKAKAVATAFADGYSEYVRTGSFPCRTRRYNV